eukprot:UN02028
MTSNYFKLAKDEAPCFVDFLKFSKIKYVHLNLGL